MKCPYCEKRTFIGDAEIEITDQQIDGNELRIEVIISRTCSECSGPLLQAYLTAEDQVEHDCPLEEAEFDYEIQDIDTDIEEHKTHICATLNCAIQCNNCGESISTVIDVVEDKSCFEQV